MAEDHGVSRSKPLILSGALVGETIGTFAFTFSGTATVLAVHKLSHTTTGFTALGDIAISVAFAFGVVASVYLFAAVSGAHINPAVTVALAAVGDFPWVLVLPYVVAQFVGGCLAALMNWFMFGDALRHSLILGGTHPGVGVAWWTACFTEFVITAVLMIAVMATAVYKRGPAGGMASGLAIGLWVGAAIFLALPISGGSLNPARTLGPDIISLQFPFWWIYIIGPGLGACFGAALWKFVIARAKEEAVEAVGEGRAVEGEGGEGRQAA